MYVCVCVCLCASPSSSPGVFWAHFAFPEGSSRGFSGPSGGIWGPTRGRLEAVLGPSLFCFGASLELRARLHAFDHVHVRRRCALTRGAQALRTCSAHICAEGTQQKTRARAHKFWYTQQKTRARSQKPWHFCGRGVVSGKGATSGGDKRGVLIF